MVLIVNHALKQAMRFSKQAMVLNYQAIFKANNGFELLNHVSKSKQASKQAKRIFLKKGLNKIPSFKQAYRSEVFRTCTVVLGYHSCILDFAWSANLVHASWHLKETVAHTGVYRVNALTKLW